ncbi:MAG: DUF4254 domain-containing protein [Elusimicrobia bacterium]|nr:DUF4254 domain-containing protein [Elusimicrobiota bacterium]
MNRDTAGVYSRNIIRLQDIVIEGMHSGKDIPGGHEDGFFLAVRENAATNFRLWHLEDEARKTDIDDSAVADVKRKIDKDNQRRNDLIEEMDEGLASVMPAVTAFESEEIPLNSETPGSIIDRLSITGLKVYHMKEQTERYDVGEDHLKECSRKLAILTVQRNDLARAFDRLMDDLKAKRRQFRIYRQFKMYNDPALNPALYENKDQG